MLHRFCGGGGRARRLGTSQSSAGLVGTACLRFIFSKRKLTVSGGGPWCATSLRIKVQLGFAKSCQQMSIKVNDQWQAKRILGETPPQLGMSGSPDPFFFAKNGALRASR